MRVPNMVQTEQTLNQTLDTLYAESQKGKSFTGILELVTNEQVIVTAMHNVKSNKGAKTPGVDGKDINHYLQMEKHSLLDLVRKALADYQPRPVKRRFILKSDGKSKRPLGIPTVIDRIIQECLRIVLEPILDGKFYSHSYGFRPYRAAQHAVARVINGINHKKYWTIEGDIKGFFDNVNHRILLEKVKKMGVLDKRILEIIKKMLKAGVLEGNKYESSDKGTPQGGILSPLLANAYLNDFDWTIARMFSEPHIAKNYTDIRNAQAYLKSKGKLPKLLTRYADDWVIQTHTEDDARKLLRWLHKYFRHRLKIELSPQKTLLTDCRKEPVKFLGFCIIAGEKRDSDKIVGKSYPNPDRVNKQIRNLLDFTNGIKQTTDVEHLALLLEKLNSKLVGIAEYWKTGMAKKVLSKIDWHVHWKLWFCHKSKQGLGNKLRTVRLSDLSNRPNRHCFDSRGKPMERETKTLAVELDGMMIGVTHAALTPISYGLMFNKKLSPFTEEGRKLKYASLSKNPPLCRPTLYDTVELQHVLNKREKDKIYNFEYLMNREYAFNQTLRKGQFVCPACKELLVQGSRHCHHKNPKLALYEINKVRNLVWLCDTDHRYVENGIPEHTVLDTKRKTYIEKLRSIKSSVLD